MEKLVEKLSSYQLLNYLIPGIIFLWALDLMEIVRFDFSNVLMTFWGGYFIGMVLSRMGSLFIEPWFKKWEIVVYAPYSEYLKAEAKDSKITVLSNENNMYRTFVAMFLLLIVLYVFKLLPYICDFIQSKWIGILVISVLLLIFVLSYRKQTEYIRKRVEYTNNTKTSENEK